MSFHFTCMHARTCPNRCVTQTSKQNARNLVSNGSSLFTRTVFQVRPQDRYFDRSLSPSVLILFHAQKCPQASAFHRHMVPSRSRTCSTRVCLFSICYFLEYFLTHCQQVIVFSHAVLVNSLLFLIIPRVDYILDWT